MKAELQNKLFKNYPYIFRDKDLPMSQTTMCWGIETGDGWYDLLDEACSILEDIWNQYGIDVKATQVKEKFGTLRFYIEVDATPSKYPRERLTFPLSQIDKAIREAEFKSAKTCEVCGNPGKVIGAAYSMGILCDKHMPPTRRRRGK